jgi:hypothetical protein
VPRSLFLRLAIRVDDDTGLAKLLHAADHVTRAGGAPIPARDAYAGGSLAPRGGSQLRATAVVVHPARRAAWLLHQAGADDALHGLKHCGWTTGHGLKA